jgi:hypothetical protein
VLRGRRGRACLTACLLVCLAACGPTGPLKVSNIQIGRSLNSDNSVGNHTTQFNRDDTMYVAVLTDGAGAGSIGVRWRFVGRLVSEETRQVSYRGDAATEFHIQNSGGFPAGDYSVEIMIDGQLFETRTFRVAR